MRTRESIYTPAGYAVTYEKREKFRGWGTAPVNLEYCIARKNGEEFFAFYDREGLYVKIMEVQDRIPHMARFREPLRNHILMELAPGQLIWHLDAAPDHSAVESQLVEFAQGANANGILHRDIRPWNVFVTEGSRITVIDWGNSCLGQSDIDAQDTARFVRLLKGEIDFQEAWGWSPHWYPAWCRHH